MKSTSKMYSIENLLRAWLNTHMDDNARIDLKTYYCRVYLAFSRAFNIDLYQVPDRCDEDSNEDRISPLYFFFKHVAQTIGMFCSPYEGIIIAPRFACEIYEIYSEKFHDLQFQMGRLDIMRSNESITNDYHNGQSDLLKKKNEDLKMEILIKTIKKIWRVSDDVLVSQNDLDRHGYPAEEAPDPNNPCVELSQGIKVGSYEILRQSPSAISQISSFDGKTVNSEIAPWLAIDSNCEFLIYVAKIDNDEESEFGQVFCESRINSPYVWGDVVRRLRVGIRRLRDGRLTMDLRAAVRRDGEFTIRRVKPLSEINEIIGFDLADLLKKHGATAVGTRAELFGETNHTRQWLAVIFPEDNLMIPVIAHVATTILAMTREPKPVAPVKSLAPVKPVVPVRASVGGATNDQSIPIKREARPYIQLRWFELKDLAESEFEDVDILQKVLSELKYRSTSKAVNLYKIVADRISELSVKESQAFRWPSTAIIGDSSSALRCAHFDYEEGLLKFMGYAVGQNGAYRNKRQQVLDYVFNEQVPKVQSLEYMAEWGNPQSDTRLKKLANSLATFTRNARRRRNSDMNQAIIEWEEDISYLKNKYYTNRFGFDWPEID
jgi:hypothetical protein